MHKSGRDAFSCGPKGSQNRGKKELCFSLTTVPQGPQGSVQGRKLNILPRHFPKQYGVLPRGGQAGAGRRKMIPSRSPVALETVKKRKALSFSCSNSNDGGCRHAFQPLLERRVYLQAWCLYPCISTYLRVSF